MLSFINYNLYFLACQVLAASAMLTPCTLRDVCSELYIYADNSFFLNLGNDRPNISTSVHRMKNASDFDALKPHLNLNVTVNEDPKTIIFMNTVKLVQHSCRYIKGLVRKCIDYIYAHRSSKDKRKVMWRFHAGKIQILIATEAAGIGADIPDIEVAIQFGIPSSLSIFKQHIGWAGCWSDIQAWAILLVEQKMFE
ncbi:P-loop containing nucleoside triphosphate hydrolase protein [Desarmillaria tabescens]|uniref:DNA 3'-5' helicase n=1 Tax=Armillaria tabescens TaxID=1929756 RepID=A0AA39K4E1_ARMTA|nr:P-loop containing nucleoside triphosphate hydrolase protein [Desarmillaria tabescens]KAK0451963.1 P-loop containing nucleoside triphosphate hydrolase protein [Desarmillaria tabescens]